MKIDYTQTIQKAKELGLLDINDKYVLCEIEPKEGRNMGVAQELFIYKYNILFAINHNEVKLIDVDKKTGELVGSKRVFQRDNIRDIVPSWLFSWNVYFRTYKPDNVDNFKFHSKFGGFNQKEAVKDIVAYIKNDYTLPMKEARKKK